MNEKPVLKVPESEAPWMDVANGEQGVTEVSGSKSNPRVIEYHDVTSLSADDDATSWCASFASWVLSKAGYRSPRTAWARDFEGYGTKITSPKYGCLMGFERNGVGGDSHIAFYTGEEDRDNYYVLGGNQDNTVKIKGYLKKDLIYMRWPVKSITEEALPLNRIALSWEKTTEVHDERKPWSDKLISLIDKDLSLYLNAFDITKVHPFY